MNISIASYLAANVALFTCSVYKVGGNLTSNIIFHRTKIYPF